ncbi:MAG: hypothetical protein R6U17_05190 [Thermoplasmata archaeon]
MDKKTSLKDKIENVKNTPYAILVYSLTITAICTLLVFSHMDICLMNTLIPIVAVVIPYHIYKERNIKKIVYAGVIALILLASIGTLYHIDVFYSQEPATLDSEHVKEARLNRLYGDADTEFEATLQLHDSIDEVNQVFVNFTYQSLENPMETEEIFWDLVTDDNISFNYTTALGKENVFNYHFSINYTDGNNIVWEETDKAFGPLTMSKVNLAPMIMIQRTIMPFITFLLIIGLLWWKEKMKASKAVGSDVLDKKESKLEEYCNSCGEFLDDKGECPNCDDPVVRCKKCNIEIPRDTEVCPNYDSRID